MGAFVNINPGGPAGGSGTQYFVGEFDGIQFICDPDQSGEAAVWLDHGSDFYAGVTWSNVPESDGRRILPRADEQLGIHTRRAHQPMAQRHDCSSVSHSEAHLRWLAVGAKASRGTSGSARGTRARILRWIFAAADLWLYQRSGLNELLDMEMTLSEAFPNAPFVINIHTGTAEVTAIAIDPREGNLTIDRTHSGIKEFHPAFAASSRHAAPLRIANGILKIRFLLDTSSLEIFAQDGEIALTDLIFPSAGKRSIGLSSEGENALSMPKVERIRIYKLRSAMIDH